MTVIKPGLERITALVQDLAFSWKTIHVAGTNGKGSVCHHASSMLLGRNLKVGTFTSPHLVDRWDCISINGQPITEARFRLVERHLLGRNERLGLKASPFEILTAAAFLCFRDAQVKVGVVEVGMGGGLDSTNIVENKAVSVITKIAHDHQRFLGGTLAEIARHKAGILKPQVPYIINAANEANIQTVIDDHASWISAGPRLTYDSFDLQERLYQSSKWLRVTRNFSSFQEDNLKLAVVAVMQTLKALNQDAPPMELAKILLANAKTHHPGRQETVHATPVFKEAFLRRHHILVDGAHNPDAADALRRLVRDTYRFGQSPIQQRPVAGWPVTWVIAMTKGKDARDILAKLLLPGDKIVTTQFGPVDGMPWVEPFDPEELLQIAKSVQPDIVGVHVPVTGALRALSTAKYMSDQLAPWAPIVLTGSLYLVGDLHRELRPRADKTWWTDPSEAAEADRKVFLAIQAEERERVEAVLKPIVANAPEGSITREQTKMQAELDKLKGQVESIEMKEKLLFSRILGGSGVAMTALERLELEDQRFAEKHSTPAQIADALRRAEKAKASLVKYQLKLDIQVQERLEKKELREAQLLRRVERRERKLEAKRLRKGEQRDHLENNSPKPLWLLKKQAKDEMYGKKRSPAPQPVSETLPRGEMESGKPKQENEDDDTTTEQSDPFDALRDPRLSPRIQKTSKRGSGGSRRLANLRRQETTTRDEM